MKIELQLNIRKELPQDLKCVYLFFIHYKSPEVVQCGTAHRHNGLWYFPGSNPDEFLRENKIVGWSNIVDIEKFNSKVTD